MFEKVLRAFETGGLTFSDLQLTLKQQLADGGSPDDLLKIMRRRELIEPLPDYAHAEILAIIQAEKNVRSGNVDPADAEQASPQRGASGRPAEDNDPDEPAMARLLQALAVEWDPEPGKGAAAFAGTAGLEAWRAAKGAGAILVPVAAAIAKGHGWGAVFSIAMTFNVLAGLMAFLQVVVVMGAAVLGDGHAGQMSGVAAQYNRA